MKILVCGDVHAGKSTLIRRLCADINDKMYGYITVRRECDDGVARVYLYDIASPPEKLSDAAVIIELDGENYKGRPELLDTLGVKYLSGIPEGSLVVLDEIGTLETRAPEFQRAVMKILSGNYRVLASVKAQNTEFLRAVRSHPDCELYIITPENRDRLYAQIKKEYGDFKYAID